MSKVVCIELKTLFSQNFAFSYRNIVSNFSHVAFETTQKLFVCANCSRNFCFLGPSGTRFHQRDRKKNQESTRDKNIISHDKEEPSLKVIFLPCHWIKINFNFKYIQRVLALCHFWFWEKITLAKYLPYAIFGYFISLLRFALCEFWSILFH